MATDFWGVVFPNYISAFGGLAGTVLAVVSLVLGLNNRRKTVQVKAEADTTRDVLADTIDAAAGAQEDYTKIARDWMRAMKGMEDPHEEQAMREFRVTSRRWSRDDRSEGLGVSTGPAVFAWAPERTQLLRIPHRAMAVRLLTIVSLRSPEWLGAAI